MGAHWTGPRRIHLTALVRPPRLSDIHTTGCSTIKTGRERPLPIVLFGVAGMHRPSAGAYHLHIPEERAHRRSRDVSTGDQARAPSSQVAQSGRSDAAP